MKIADAAANARQQDFLVVILEALQSSGESAGRDRNTTSTETFQSLPQDLSSMSYDQEPISPMFRIDVSAEAESEPAPAESPETRDRMAVDLLRQLVIGQQQQNKLLDQLCQQNAAMQQQRAAELQQWKSANPELAKSCRQAAETLSKVQTQFLDNLTDEIEFHEDNLLEGEFMMNEFVDRFGPRLAHLNGVLQVLAQLGTSDPTPQ